MKSYTDLEQSKKLAEILPLESADMTLPFRHTKDDKYLPGYVGARSYIDVYNDMIALPGMDKEQVCKLIQPCWSLAALLGIMPKEVKIKGQMYAPCLFPITDGHWLYKLWYNSNEIIESPIAVWCDNPLDACVEMIIKLHELNLL